MEYKETHFLTLCVSGQTVLERHHMAENVVLPNHSLVLPTWSSFTIFIRAKMLALCVFVLLFFTCGFLP
jgi:hypothetical protein